MWYSIVLLAYDTNAVRVTTQRVRAERLVQVIYIADLSRHMQQGVISQSLEHNALGT